MKKWVVLVAVVVAGCGTVARSTGVMNLGPDTYRVAARASLGAVGESQRMAISEGQAYCNSMKLEFMVVGTRVLSENGSFEVTFRCLRAGDPDLKRPNLERVPDTLIQVR